MTETMEETIERVNRRITTEPFAICLTKMQWAQILGMLQGIAFAPDDIRTEAAGQLAAEIRTALGMDD